MSFNIGLKNRPVCLIPALAHLPIYLSVYRSLCYVVCTHSNRYRIYGSEEMGKPLVPSVGLEPTTNSLEGCCSVLLSYEGIILNISF